MPRVHPMAPFSAQFFGGAEVLEVAAGNLFGLVEALDRLAPGFGENAGVRVAFAVDGMIQADWSAALAPGAEVMVIPRVAGGGVMADMLSFRELAPFGV